MMKKTLYNIVTIITVVCMLIIGSAPTLYAYAAESASSVLDDLKKDPRFDPRAYTHIADDHGLELIQIAESTASELLVYVYQPIGPHAGIYATSINIARQLNNTDGLTFDNYKLEYLNSSGVFFKYRVKDVEVTEDPQRLYNISAIYRAYIADKDPPPTGDNTVSEVAYPVGQLWVATTENGGVSYSMKKTDVIEITNKYVSYARTYSGFTSVFLGLFPTSHFYCDGHFIAFSTDYRIDELQSATVEYTEQRYHGQPFPNKPINEKIDSAKSNHPTKFPAENKTAELYHDKYNDAPAYGWFMGESYTWKQIMRADEFVKEFEFGDEAKKQILRQQWVLSFAVTSIDVTESGTYETVDWSDITDTVILRLQFVIAGRTYNLGVVDDKQTGTRDPTNIVEEGTLPWWVWIVVSCTLILVVCCVFPQVVPFLLKGVMYLFKGLWWLICLPFRGIRALADKARENKGR